MTVEDKDGPASEGLTSSEQQSRGFAADQMVACEKCVRANPPTRTSCLYCGAQLPVNEASAALRRPTLKPLEEWEQGVNVVLMPEGAGGVSAGALGEAASLLRIEPDRLRGIAASGLALPVARASTEDEAGLIVKQLRARGLRTETFPDESLAVSSRPARRARSLEWSDGALALRTSLDSEPERVAWGDIILFVVGRVFTKRVEVEEKHRRGRGEIVEARELLASDEPVLDIYPAQDDGRFGWRVAAENFDYSCLGDEKGLLARDNFVTLTSLLRERAHAARFDDGYARARQLLAAAWPLAEHTEAQGLRRGRGGRLNTEAVTIISNETQFTRYSRTRWRLALRGAGAV